MARVFIYGSGLDPDLNPETSANASLTLILRP